MGLEIAEQFEWEAPDVLYPTGGVETIGIYKALKELREMGWIGRKKCHALLQFNWYAPIVKAWKEGKKGIRVLDDAKTIGFGITVLKALETI